VQQSWTFQSFGWNHVLSDAIPNTSDHATEIVLYPKQESSEFFRFNTIADRYKIQLLRQHTSATLGGSPHQLRHIDYVCFVDCVRHIFHGDSVAPDKKLSVPLPRVSYHLLSPYPNARGLCHYNITANTLNTGGSAITLLPQIHSITW
jgi:hypothetical protein